MPAIDACVCVCVCVCLVCVCVCVYIFVKYRLTPACYEPTDEDVKGYNHSSNRIHELPIFVTCRNNNHSLINNKS